LGIPRIAEESGRVLKNLQILVFLPFLGIFGCSNIQPPDVVGAWILMDRSRGALPAELKQAPARLVLNADGTFVASDLPGLFYFAGHHGARLDSGTGLWKLASREGKQQLQLEFQAIAGWKDALPYGTQVEVSKGVLFYFLGDADEGRRVSFEKKQPLTTA
jgi:hypothetical protein